AGKVAAAPHSACANRSVLLFFIVIFYRSLREAIEVDCARTRLPVAAAELKGCGHARSCWRRSAACAPGQGRPKVADRRSHCFFIVIYNERRRRAPLSPPLRVEGRRIMADRSDRPSQNTVPSASTAIGGRPSRGRKAWAIFRPALQVPPCRSCGMAKLQATPD